jgi:phage regulator Rha-like protein
MSKGTKKRPAREDAITATGLVPLERIEQAIYVFRGQRVMLDTDLAAFYGVQTKRLNEQVRRNAKRFPADFMFQLTSEESAALRSQFATLNTVADTRVTESLRGKHRKYRPYAFTEHGALMVASVLNSRRAVDVSVLVVRAFVRLRHILAEHRELARQIEALERKFTQKTDAHERHIRDIYKILDELMNPTVPPTKRRIGFVG